MKINSADFAGKNIILISPSYFNYEKEIQNEFERRGASVYFIDDRIKNDTLNKALFRLNLGGKARKKRIFEYFDSHLQQIKKKKADFLIAIIPEGFSKEIITYYKQNLEDTIFILYMWDSIDNRPYIIDTLDLYEKTFTFDKSNSVKYGLKFRPLFFTKEYMKIGLNENKQSFKYNLCFIGTAHSDRYNVIKKIIGGSNKHLETFFLFYLQSPILILYYWIIDPMFRKIKVNDISFNEMSKSDVLSVIENSCCIIDINHPKQSGLTIRTIEALGAKRKIITTNEDIVNYDFYNPHNILLVDRYDPVFDNSFLDQPYKEIDSDIYNRYFLSQWVDDLIYV